MKKESTKNPINLFIDTNILLDFYRFSDADLDALGKFEDLIVKARKIKLYVTQQQVNEFYRNRDKVIKEHIGSFKYDSPRFPKAFCGHTDYNTVVNESRELAGKIDKIKRDILEEAFEGKLKVDIMVENILRSPIATSEDIFNKAKMRMDVGNPPGKNGSLGDAINWEILLESVDMKDDFFTDIHIISRDGDFSSVLDGNKLSTFLEKEWSSKKFGTAYLYKSLNNFLDEHFPDIKLIDEAIKDGIVEQIGSASSFDNARALIAELYRKGSLSEDQVKVLYKSAISNDQVYNAHRYSPTIVGDRLWELIKPYWGKFTKKSQKEWLNYFPGEYTQDIDDKLTMLRDIFE